MIENTCDVIVIGSGFAGLAAAIEAASAGSSVIVLEKMKAAGGNSIISDGGMAAAGTSLQIKHGISDSTELFYKDMMAAGMGLNYPELVRKLTDESAGAFDWLANDIGAEFMNRVDLFGGHSLPRSHGAVKVTGVSIIKPMLKRLTELGAAVKYSHNVEKIIIENNRVRGVIVSPDYNYKTGSGRGQIEITAEKAVILAGGGFGADIEFRSSQDPRLGKEIDTTNKPFAKADLLREAMRAGAVPVQLSHIQLGPWASPDEKGFGDGPLFTDYTGFIYGIIVNPDSGRRFINEQADRKILSDAILAAEKPCVCISDSTAVKNTGWDISKALRKGVVKTFETLDELAENYEIPSASLADSVNQFNRIADGLEEDRFGRTLPSDAEGIRSAPYYAMRIWPKVHYTMGGVKIDEEARVIGFGGNPIQGLFAAGEITGGVHGACRLGSCAVTSCIVFGRIAGANAARN